MPQYSHASVSMFIYCMLLMEMVYVGSVCYLGELGEHEPTTQYSAVHCVRLSVSFDKMKTADIYAI